jgi:hypothetical protein
VTEEWNRHGLVGSGQSSSYVWKDPANIYRILDEEGRIYAPGYLVMGTDGVLVSRPAAAECSTDRKHNVGIQRLSVEGLRS